MDKLNKVYCRECKHYKYDYLCTHPSNYEDTHEKPKGRISSQAAVINRYNNCKWFEEKTGWFDFLFRRGQYRE